mgnify:CR=1 FL=1
MTGMETTIQRINDLEELLESSICGLEWYRDRHPESWSEADEEHLAKCNAAMARYSGDNNLE